MKLFWLLVVLLSVVVLAGCATGGVPEAEVAQLYYNLGNTYFELNQLDSAIRAYQHAISLDESLVTAGYNLARVHIESGKIEEGKKLLEQLLEEDPENSILLGTLGWAYYLQSDFDSSLALYLQILERIANVQNALFNAAVLSEKLDKKDDALVFYLQLYDLKPSAEVLYRLGYLYFDLNEPAKAIEYLEVYRKEAPEDYDGLLTLSRAYALERYYANALELYDLVLEVNENDPVVYFEKAEIQLLYIENLEEGIKSLRAALEYEFDDNTRLMELLDSPELKYRDDVSKLYDELGALKEEEQSDEETEEAAEAAEEPTDKEPEEAPSAEAESPPETLSEEENAPSETPDVVPDTGEDSEEN